VTSAQRMKVPALASLPTLVEGGLPSFNFTVCHGLYAPRGTPPEMVEKLNAALRSALKDPELIKRQEALGITVVTDGRLAPAEHRKFFDSEVTRWAKTIKDAGVQPE
jgi:tripartite-type tricarboxylate transporter receptor subunit TctC